MSTLKSIGLGLVLALLLAFTGVVITSASIGRRDSGAVAPVTPRVSHRDPAAAKAPAEVFRTPRAEPSQTDGPIIIDHTCTDLSEVPDYWIEQAKVQHRVSYGHTSHGSQPISGMGVLMANTPSGLHDFNTNGAVTPGVLSIADSTPTGDLGNPDRTTWAARTRAYLDGPGSNRNVVVWSWCGQVSSASTADIQTYLNLMNGLEQDYPDVTFVYMTGHLDGSGVEGNLNQRNNQIRQYCTANNKVLFDFADIESYDPDGSEFLSRYAWDECGYVCDPPLCNWADEWCAAHAGDPLCASCSCAHSRSLNCNLKARAFWWMMARLAGWDGSTEEATPKSPSTAIAWQGEVVTYTITIEDLAAPPDATIYMTDVVPSGLAYISETLTASAGTVTDTAAPTLQWSGALSPEPIVVVTYAVTVTASDPQAIRNTANIEAPGHDAAAYSATLLVNPRILYLSLGMKSY